MDQRTGANTPGRHTDRARRQQASTNRNGMGATPPMARATSRTPALLPAQGRQRDGPRQGHPLPHWPPGRTDQGNGTQASPPQNPPPGAGTPQTRRPTPRGAHSPKPGRVETGLGRPPPKNQPNGAWDRGSMRGGARTEWNGPTSAQHRDCAKRACQTNQGRGGGAWTPRERERTHTQMTRGEYQKGNRTEPAERTDRMEWHTSDRGQGTPRRDGPPHTAQDTRGGKRETGRTRHQAAARDPRTGRERRAHTTRALRPPRQ